MQIKFDVSGMTCAACSARVEKVTAAVSGVEKVDVNLLAGKMVVTAESESVISEISAAVAAAGYGVTVAGEDKKQEPEKRDDLQQMKRRVLWSAACLVVLMYFTMGHMIGLPAPNWYHGRENALVAALLQFFLTLPPVFLNRVYFTRGAKSLLHGAPNMDSLIMVGSGASLVYGVFALFRMSFALGHADWVTVELYSSNLYFESAAMIVTLITFGKFLETRAKGKTGDAIRQLMDLTPKTATVYRNGVECNIPVDSVVLGDIVIVRSGSSIPVDGTVVKGRASVDQSALTGESIPIERAEGDVVSAATIAVEGYLEVRADRIGEDTTLAQVIRMVEEAGGSKAPIARLADKIAGIFVPTVMCIAAVAFVVWMIAGKSLEFSLTTAISVLVISCPCALGLATPVAIMVGTGRGAQMGVLFKNAEALENLHKIDTVVLDKTGTLTCGKPQVTDILAANGDHDALLILAASLEIPSEHPFAKAIVAKAKNTVLKPAEDFMTLPGQGVSAIINNVRYYGGNRSLMEKISVSVPEYPELAEAGKTPLYFAAENGVFLGVIAAADVLKPDSTDAVAAMRKEGIEVVMLTGDNEKTAKAVARNAGIDKVVSDVLPVDKATEIKKLRDSGRNVLMVGDGINDAPALVTADVGMAIGAGTDIAIESADVVLMNSSLIGVADAVSLSKATIRNIRQNLFWAFFYNVLGIPIAAGVLYPAFGILLNPMIGAAAMSFSSVFVVTNALRLRFFQNKNHKDTDQPENEVVVKPEEVTNMDKVIKVNGMMCPHCKARVEAVCKAVAGTADAVVDLQEKQVTVSGDAPLEALEKAITDAGYEVVH